MNKRSLIALTCALAAYAGVGVARSAEPAVVRAEASSENTSDGISRRSVELGYRSHRRDLIWPYEKEAQSAFDVGANAQRHEGSNGTNDYAGTRLALLAAHKFSPLLLLEAEAGGHELRNESTRQSRSIFAGELRAVFNYEDRLNGTLRLARDYVYQELVQPGGLSDFLTATSLLPQLSFRAHERVRVLARGAWRYYSDGNTRRQLDVSTLYGIAIGTPWIWAGVGAEIVSFEDSTPKYWSPGEFVSYGARLEAATSFGGKWSGQLGFNLNRFHDRDANVSGTGYYGAVRLQYGSRNETHAQLFAVHTKSARNGGGWHSNQVGVNLVVPF